MALVLHNLHCVAQPTDATQVLYTVRLGTKWYERQPKDLTLCACLYTDGGEDANDKREPYLVHTIVGQAKVVECQTMLFTDIPAHVVKNEHSLAARTSEGLLAAMRHAYGDTFSQTDMVTVIGYVRLPLLATK